jgi:hypothetical protein
MSKFCYVQVFVYVLEIIVVDLLDYFLYLLHRQQIKDTKLFWTLIITIVIGIAIIVELTSVSVKAVIPVVIIFVEDVIIFSRTYVILFVIVTALIIVGIHFLWIYIYG